MVLASCHRVGGFETKLDRLIRYFDKKKFELTLMLVYPYYKAKKLDESVRTQYRSFLSWSSIATEELFMKRRYDFFVLFRVAQFIRKYRADVLYFFALGAGTFIAPVSGKLARVPCMIRANDTIIKGLYPGVLKFLDRILIHFIDRIIVPSLFLKNLMVEELGTKPSKFTVIPNAIDLSPFRGKMNKTSAKRKLGIRPSTKVIGMVANLLPVKAPDVLIKAVPEVIEKFPNTLFVLAGDGPLQPDLESLAENLKVSKCIRFLGYRSDIADVIAAFDIGAMCSKVETHGISILEMMAAGVPVVAPDVGGIPEVIENEINGVLFPQGNPDQLAESVICLLSDPKIAHRLGKAGQNRVYEKFSVERMVRSTEQIFQSCLETTS